MADEKKFVLNSEEIADTRNNFCSSKSKEKHPTTFMQKGTI
jgi:hypothetical protein